MTSTPATYSPSPNVLLFLPGFLTPPSSYRVLLSPLTKLGWQVIVPRLYRPSGPVLAGSFTPADEALRAIDVVEGIPQSVDSLVIAGHSRGGQVALLTALQLRQAHRTVDGLMLVDPVDGTGPRQAQAYATDLCASFDVPTLIVGAGAGGRCAPASVNHVRFAAAIPTCQYEVVPGMSHADVLSGRLGDLARLLCGSNRSNADRHRSHTTMLLSSFLAERGSIL